jgi:predicted dehydrogenase
MGVFGEISEAAIHYDLDMPSWMAGMGNAEYSAGGGINFGIGCHSLDQALHFFGRPTAITAFYRMLRNPDSRYTATEQEDSFSMTLEYDDQKLVHVKTNALTSMAYPLKHFIRGSQGTWVKYGIDPQEEQIQAGLRPGDNGFGEEGQAMWGELTTRGKVLESQVQVGGFWVGKVESEKGDYGMYYADVARAIHGEIEQVVKGETSRDGIRAIELARQSAIERRTVMWS